MENDSNSEPEVQESKPKKKQIITAKQRAARLENLKKGRATRMKKLAEKKKEVEYHVEDSDSDDSIDIDSLVVSRRKPAKEKKQKRKQDESDDDKDSVRKELAEMKQMMQQMSKKRQKPRKQSGGTKIVVLPPTQSQMKANPEYDSYIQQLSRALGKK